MKPIEINTPHAAFFAAANTGSGFVSYYGELLADLSRVWYIKGGPGTGKSRLMERIATEGERRGFSVLRYLCSSDPTSLDGVIIPALGFGIVDATAPHSSDPRYPGAGDALIDVGAFWNAAELATHRAEIVALGREKSKAYRAAYTCLSAELAAARAVWELAAKCIRKDGLAAAAMRRVKRYDGGQKISCEHTLFSAISMKGRHHITTFEQIAEECICLPNTYGIGQMFLQELVSAAQQMQKTVWCALDPLEPSRLREVYFPAVRTLYTIEKDVQMSAATVCGLSRFFDRIKLREAKPALQALSHAKALCAAAAASQFSVAAKAHFALEHIYTEAMDFAQKEAFEAELCARIFADIQA